jgi:hypothetical protein
MTIEFIGAIHDCHASEILPPTDLVLNRGYRRSRAMQSRPLRALATWLIALRNLASALFAPGPHSKHGRDTAVAWDVAADDELVLYAALITAAHY